MNGRRMTGLAKTVTLTFVCFGALASTSLLAALAVMTLFVDAPQVAEWFLVSAILTGVSFAGAIVSSRWRA